MERQLFAFFVAQMCWASLISKGFSVRSKGLITLDLLEVVGISKHIFPKGWFHGDLPW